MSCSLNFIFIVIFLSCWPSPSSEESNCASCETFDLKTIIIVSLGGCILAAILVLIVLIICVYAKLGNSTKSVTAAKTCVAGPLKNNNSAVDPHAKSVTPVSSATVQLCEECSMYAAYDPLPPCFCDSNEGL